MKIIIILFAILIVYLYHSNNDIKNTIDSKITYVKDFFVNFSKK